MISWKDYIKLWCEIQGVPNGGYQEITVEDYDKAMPGGLGREVGEMYAYAGEFGYDGSDPSIIHPKDVSSLSDLMLGYDGTKCSVVGGTVPDDLYRRVFQDGRLVVGDVKFDCTVPVQKMFGSAIYPWLTPA